MTDQALPEYTRIAVWDLPVRAYHWLQFVLVAVAAVTGFLLGGRWIDVHVWAGAALAALLVMRIIWGFAGSTYARFSTFLPAPRTVFSHVRELKSGTARPHLGHNPLGALMILALVAVIAGLVVSGTIIFGGVFKKGPGAAFFSFATGFSAREIHELLAFALLGLVGLHIAGAFFESWRTGENLARAMVTGSKRLEPGRHEERPIAARPLVAVVTILVLFGAAVPLGLSLAAIPPSGMPVAQLDPVYRQECTACHMAYHPSLLPTASWQALMDNLDDHFGEDASLDPETATTITAFLTANAAETADTKPANAFRRLDPASPYELTATPFWKRMHGEIPDSVFSAKPVSSKANCAACHRDAEAGAFYPANINIPKEDLK